MVNWGLHGCCKKDQKIFLITIGIWTVLILAIVKTILLHPLMVIDHFWQQLSHATAAILTCGKVHGIQFDELGAMTRIRGGANRVILLAGHLGSSLVGMAFILSSTNLIAARIAAGCFLAVLLILIVIVKNWTVRGIYTGVIMFIVMFWALQEKTSCHILRYIVLSVGVINTICSGYGIYDNAISRRIAGNNAEEFAEACPCPCNGVAWGVIWGFISILFFGGAIYFGLVILS